MRTSERNEPLTREKTDYHWEFPVHASVQDEALTEHSVRVEAKQRGRHPVLRSHQRSEPNIQAPEEVRTHVQSARRGARFTCSYPLLAKKSKVSAST